eukprot:CAMPEP_0116882642 /NCGR_PEP_ID=MMETSP0463-20121206/14941_1 /TAXON_ID=181622 /ORGANISM="Strombidinopsis sp, Strain SopsisLIS2011" /LENGTH=78 /DNA_ID=CAMNT_0004536165 /DNA_START=79 /DNA_END=315 /DNA_ORIENTATION=+
MTQAQSSSSDSSDVLPAGSKGFYICLFVAIFLVLFGGCMSGLTVGLMSIDKLELEILLESGTEEEIKQAQAILPLIAH